MKLHELSPSKGSVKKGKRVGRGEGSNRGGTSTRGHKGAQSRSGYSKKRNFEGGQMPLQKRVPKRGFFSRNRKTYEVFNLDRLQNISEKYGVTTIDMDFLRANSFIGKNDQVKILGSGEISVALSISASACSEKAKELVEKAGGTITIV